MPLIGAFLNVYVDTFAATHIHHSKLVLFVKFYRSKVDACKDSIHLIHILGVPRILLL